MSDVNLATKISNFLRSRRDRLHADFRSMRWGVFPEVRRFGLFWCRPQDIRLATLYFPASDAKYLEHQNDLDMRSIQVQKRSFISGGDWDLHTAPIEQVTLIQRTIRRYNENRTWDEVGEVDWMMRNIQYRSIQDGCASLDDVKLRCLRLDALKADLESGGDYKTQRQLRRGAFREAGGIGVAIARDGNIIWMSEGAHRLGIAKFLRLPSIPVALLMVHEDAIVEHRLFTYLGKSRTDLLAGKGGGSNIRW